MGDIYIATDLENAWIATAGTSADWEQLDAAGGGGGGPSVSTGAGAPVSTPSAEGDIYIDTTNDVSYMAVGTASSGDWKQTSNLPQGLTSVSQDTSPTLGGNLDGGGFAITNIGNVDGRDVSADGTKLDGIEANATADQTGAEIKAAYEAEANTNAYTDAEKTKLAGISAGAEVNAVDSVNTQTGAVVLDADDISDAATTNKFTTAAEISKLAGIESGATADQTGAEIKAAYEAEADTNAFTDAYRTKLDGIAAGAEVNVIESVVEDTTPQLGGDLDGNNFSVKNIDDLTIDEAADHTTTPAAGFSTIWVRNDTPTTLMHSDDAGNDYEIHPPFAVVPFVTDATALTISCSSTDKLLNGNGVLTSIDLSRFTQARITVIRGGTARAGLIIGVRYNATLSLTYGAYSALGASSTDVEVSCPSANTAYASSWIDITSAARGDVAIACYQRNVSVTGNAGFVRILLELR